MKKAILLGLAMILLAAIMAYGNASAYMTDSVSKNATAVYTKETFIATTTETTTRPTTTTTRPTTTAKTTTKSTTTTESTSSTMAAYTKETFTQVSTTAGYTEKPYA